MDWTSMSPGTFVLIEALYKPVGVARDATNVTGIVKARIVNGRLEMDVSSDELGADPYRKHPKELVLKWRIGDAHHRVAYPEGAHISLP